MTSYDGNDKVGTLSSILKTQPVHNATAGTGGLLGDVAKIVSEGLGIETASLYCRCRPLLALGGSAALDDS